VQHSTCLARNGDRHVSGGHAWVCELPDETNDEALLCDERNVLQPGTHRIFVQLTRRSATMEL